MTGVKGAIKTTSTAYRMPIVCNALVALGMPILRAWGRNGGGTMQIEMEGHNGPYRVSTTSYDVAALHSIFTGPNPPTTTGEAIRLMLAHCRKAPARHKPIKTPPLWINPKIAPETPFSP